MSAFEVRRDDLRTVRLVEDPHGGDTAGEGELRLRIDRFGLTANNVTYGVLGHSLDYWSLYPAGGEGWGRVPAWGYCDVMASGVDGIEAGERFYGFLPMSSHVTLRAAAAGPGFFETSEHRADLSGVYNFYLRVDPAADFADEQLLLRPLFATSFVIEDFVRSNGFFGGGAVAFSSASSKTAYGTAFLLGRATDRPQVIGLTSPGHRSWVESLGLYDKVVTYDTIEHELAEGEPLVFVDMAGNAAVRAAVHRSAADRLRRSVTIGVTHWEEAGTGAESELSGAEPDLPGPTPEFFFAPTHIGRLAGEIGGAEFQRRLGQAWHAFAPWVAGFIEIERGVGPEALERTWLALVDGTADPACGYVVSLP